MLLTARQRDENNRWRKTIEPQSSQRSQSVWGKMAHFSITHHCFTWHNFQGRERVIRLLVVRD